MSTTIEWTQRPGTTGETWNPVVGCTKVSQGCKHCYAKTLHDKRHKAYPAGKLQGGPQYAKPFEQVQLMYDRLTLPLKWKKPRTVFVNSVSDLFHPDVPFEFIDEVFAVMALTPQHTYQVLTKRPERMAEYLNNAEISIRVTDILPREYIAARYSYPDDLGFLARGGGFSTNVWLGTSVEDQTTANERIPHLLKCPAAVRFLSCEPLLETVDIVPFLFRPVPFGAPVDVEPRNEIHWVITGGESGANARPMHPDWARSLRDQCKAAGVPFFFKQWGEYSYRSDEKLFHRRQPLHRYHDWPDGTCSLRMSNKSNGHILDGQEHHEWPSAEAAQSIPSA